MFVVGSVKQHEQVFGVNGVCVCGIDRCRNIIFMPHNSNMREKSCNGIESYVIPSTCIFFLSALFFLLSHVTVCSKCAKRVSFPFDAAFHSFHVLFTHEFSLHRRFYFRLISGQCTHRPVTYVHRPFSTRLRQNIIFVFLPVARERDNYCNKLYKTKW